MKKFTVLSLLLLSSLSSLRSIAQENCFDYLKNKKNWSFGPEQGTPTTEILLVGTFHFRKKFTVTEIERKLIDFKPEKIFVEEVRPDAEYKESYENNLTQRRGKQWYTSKIDSLVRFTGMERQHAKDNIKTLSAYCISNPYDLAARVKLINALFINKDEANANYQWYILNQQLEKNEALKDSVTKSLTPFHNRYKISAGETRFLTIPVANSLALPQIHSMDYQADRQLNDSLLSITMRKLAPRLILRFWELPYMLKMMKMDNKGPKSDKEAVEHFKILNSKKAILKMAKANERYFKSKKVVASMQWNSLYRKRNHEMVKQILANTNETHAKKILVIVGASHVPYFLWELKQQEPQMKVTLLDFL